MANFNIIDGFYTLYLLYVLTLFVSIYIILMHLIRVNYWYIKLNQFVGGGKMFCGVSKDDLYLMLLNETKVI